MKITEKIIEKFGSSSVDLEVEILDKYIFHKTPFKVRVKLTAKSKIIKIKCLEIDLIWKEMRSREVGSYHHEYSMKGEHEWYEKHLIHKQRTKVPINLAPNESFTTDLTFTTEKAKNTRFPDKFYLKIHVDIPKAIDIRERRDIEVLPYAALSSPMVAMVEKLSFKREPWKRGDDSINQRNQWILSPPKGSHPHLKRVHLTIDDPRNKEMDVMLKIMMMEDIDSDTIGIQETINLSFKIHPNDVMEPDGLLALDFLSMNILQLITEAEARFEELLNLRKNTNVL